MGFFEVLARVTELLQREGRVSYRAIKREWDLDDASLEDLKAELIEVRQVAVDRDGRMLVWAGGATSTPRTAAASVRDPEHTPLTFTPSHLTEKILAARRTLEGERKQVTVLFADIKGSTELIEGLDPEEARTLLDPALHVMVKAVHRYEGTVNQVLGDGIMALFGAPLAHEDHALRACYAALAMQAAMRRSAEAVRRAHGVEAQIRVGLNSGEVVVRAIGNDLHMDYSAVGQTTHLAARMEQLAPPGSIRLTAATLRLVEGLVQVNTLGPVPVKGLTGPVEVFELAGASPTHRRLQATAARGLSRFVGRQHELEVLYQALELAGAGHGQVVAVFGEPGVGKSRLVYEFIRSHRTRGWLVIESASVSYGKATAYFPVIDLLKRYFHVEEDDGPRTVRAKVTGQVLTLDEALQETVPAFLSLLEALPEESSFRTLDPLQRRQRTLDALKRVLLRESQVQPLTLVFEDLHWIDTETQALLDSLVESLPTARLLLLVNYRPEYQHGWGSRTYYSQLRLDPLPPASADELLRALLGADASLRPLKQLLIARTEGNPFFLEESVRTLVETQVLVGERGRYRLAQALPSIQVPATVQAVLAARIDRLPPEEKRLLQTAAVIGTEVPFPLLQAISEAPEDALRTGLAHLQGAEFLYETRLFPELEFTFKHALTHEVAYGGLLQERRRTLHARIVEAIEGLYADRLIEQVERLAYHALKGEVWEKAVTYSRQAGAKAMTRSAYQEAAGYFEQALGALQHLPESRTTREQAVDLHCDLRLAYIPLLDMARVLEHLQAAEALAEQGQFAEGRVYLDEAVRLAERVEHTITRLHAYFAVGFLSLRRGDPATAIPILERGLALAESRQQRAAFPRFAAVLGAAYTLAGRSVEALPLLEQAVEQSTSRRYLQGYALWLTHLGAAYLLAGRMAEATQCARGALEYAQTQGERGREAWAWRGLGEMQTHPPAPDLAAAEAHYRRALALADELGMRPLQAHCHLDLGALYLKLGHREQARPELSAAIEPYRAMEMTFWLPEAEAALAQMKR